MSATPYVDTCKSMVTFLSQDSDIQWEQSLKTEDGSGKLRVDVFYNGKRNNQTASCFYPTVNADNEQQQNEGNYRGSPSVITINGRRVPDENLVRAAFASTREYSKHSYDKITDSVRNATDLTSTKARQLVLDAAIEVQNSLQKPPSE